MKNNDEMEIGGLVRAFTHGWNAQDGAACARPFAVDADFTAVNGLRANGRDLIAEGHREILATIFQGSRLTDQVESIRFIRPDVALVNVTFRLRDQDGEPLFGIQKTSAGLVVTKESGVWSIVSFRNMVPFDRPVAGPFERELIAKGARG
jgi:uncharacterized protein (TIGR02246 family)